MKPQSTHTKHTENSAVDIVYLWVDGSDRRWQAKREQAIKRLSHDQVNAMAVFGNVAGRYRDNDELRFNLRSLERYFPNHGHIYIVTDDQKPAWLKPSSGLTVIDHSELIPNDRLPIFDSGNIESYIHRIPNLSEQYIYLNDDVFFGNPVSKEDWFFDGGVYTAWSSDPTVDGLDMQLNDTALVNASRFSQQWFLQNSDHLDPAIARTAHQYQHIPRTFAHAPRAMTKTMMFELERIAPTLFETVRSTTFRQWDKPTIVSDFVLRWALTTQQARLIQRPKIHLSTGEKGLQKALEKLTQQIGHISFFCVNDTLDDANNDDARLLLVRNTMHVLLSQPSAFEETASQLNKCG